MEGLGEPRRGPIRYHTSNSLLARAESKAPMFTGMRRVTILALAGGAAIAVQLTAVTPARAATPTITIAATSKIGPVTGYILVAYGGADASARIHGTITGATAGDVASLYAQPFPYEKPPAPVGSTTLGAAGAGAYSFTVKPTLATRYQVKVFARKGATTPLATSARRTLYVSANGYFTGGKNCGRPVCRMTLHIYTIVPRSILGVEMSKHLYPYVGLNLTTGTGYPPRPKWLYLNAGHASVSGARRISATEFEKTLTFSVRVGNDGYYLEWNWCAKDTMHRDGLGLPGSHGCGARRILSTVSYLG